MEHILKEKLKSSETAILSKNKDSFKPRPLININKDESSTQTNVTKFEEIKNEFEILRSKTPPPAIFSKDEIEKKSKLLLDRSTIASSTSDKPSDSSADSPFKNKIIPRIQANITRTASLTPISGDKLSGKKNLLETVNESSIARIRAGSDTNMKNTDIKIKNIVTELLDTEEAYLSRLLVIDKNFRKFFLEKADPHEKSYPGTKQIEDMFSNLFSIITFHTEFFVPALKTRISTWNEGNEIGDIFVKYGPHFKLYTIYINNYENACAAINLAAKKYSKFSHDLEERQKMPECKNLRLMHHMLDPIQRIPRYKLLLTEYMKQITPDTEEYNNIKSSLEIISASAQKANDRIRDTQNAMKLLEIQQMVVDAMDIVIAGRSFIKERDSLRKSGRGGKYVPCHLLLFNDMLMCCAKVNANKYRKKAVFEFSSIGLKENVDEKQQNAFTFIGIHSSIILSIQSVDEKSGWLDLVKKTINLYDDKIISFLVQNKANKNVSNNPNQLQHNVLMSKILYKTSSDPWTDKFLTLTSERKIVIHDQETRTVNDFSFLLDNVSVNKIQTEDLNEPEFQLIIQTNDTEFTLTSKIDDLVLDRIFNIIQACSVKTVKNSL